MARDPKYDILFEPVKIGPVTAPNRFYQVPHCNVLGHARPHAEAANRGVKAEGGWGVVCTQEVEIHPSAEITPYIEGRIWDDRDIPQHRLMTDAVHEHGALAGIELCYNGMHASNLYSRIAPLAPSAIMVHGDYPMQARAMTKRDIADLRRWHVEAAKRARRAGYDIVYVYAGHDMSVLQHFLKPQYNSRSDEYGGSLENRVRLTREVLLDVKEAVGHECAIAFRFATDELMGADGLQAESEGRDIVGMLAEIPDLWDVNISGWDNDSSTARFEPNEGYQEPYTAFVKSLTSKPVVGVGRFTSADMMVSQIKRGVLDLIGAARPSIADPFLPRKIDEGRIDEIRECIGCNICVSQDMLAAPIRCTQNPTQGEEWKQNWHPERIDAAASDDAVLVIGAGPAGLESALQLANRGYRVTLAEATEALGGRISRECELPGMASYARVRDYRENLLLQKSNVEIYLGNNLDTQQVADLGIPHVLVATGARWRRDGVGRRHAFPIAGLDQVNLLTPDDVLGGQKATGKVVVYDDDHYFMGSTIAELYRGQGHEVCLVTPESRVSIWTENTLEQEKIQARLLDLGVEVIVSHQLVEVVDGAATIANVYSHRHRQQLGFDSLVVITARLPCDELYRELLDTEDRFKTLRAIGDCNAPGTVAAAVYDGHAAARYLESGQDIYAPLFVRDMPA
ncbi:MAG: FAD-dependent oxidoreductase, partial [Gammaproteobacteria bacterium]|nr:FAD-dependent oxidoreductase [Gammaproteobacteria bacterium]